MSIEGSEFDFVGGTIDNNFTYGSGAGILLKNGAVCRMSAGTISNNRCRVDGGGMQIDFGGSCVMSGGEIVDNLAFPSANLQGQDEEPVGEELQGEHFSSGGAINARGDLTVSGGTIARNGALIGCGICYNCENWQTQKHSVTLSGSPLFQDNYLSHDPAEKTDLSIFMDKDEDETARVSIDGAFTPPRPVGIEKLYRPDWNLVALADGGDYEMSAFRNMQGDRFELVRMGDTLYARSPRSDYSANEGGQKENAADQTPVTSHANGRGQAGTSRRQLPKTGDLPVVDVGICAGVGALVILAGVFCGRTDRRDGEGASDQPAA